MQLSDSAASPLCTGSLTLARSMRATRWGCPSTHKALGMLKHQEVQTEVRASSTYCADPTVGYSTGYRGSTKETQSERMR